ncbi:MULTISPECIES: GTPase [Terrabacteria group]|uniref:GTPase n=1 Tax=Bacillati TaxID=1783272 RepID=UPI00193A3A05|nr:MULTISPECIES: GTPase [Terrabacteria group]MBW9212092.1 50S ribosome-binding GTPase [Trueperella sp. zg.1013]QRG87102.1 ribosome biogenesis GTPase YqeH [Bulleidia sp. zg-1006]
MKCIGCGAKLQDECPNEVGYSPKKEVLYCQRCFRLRHYDDPVYSKRFGIDSRLVFQQIQKQEGILIWVVDCFSMEESLEQDFVQQLQDREIILILSKRDVLPAEINEEKIAKMMIEKIHQKHLPIKKLFFHSAKVDLGKEELLVYLHQYPPGTNFIFMGLANAGKSSLLNQLLETEALTASRYPGTTLEFLKLEKDGYTFIDTPGMEVKASYLMEVNELDLKKLLPSKTLVARNYQLYSNQSYFIGALFRIDLKTSDKASLAFYFHEQLIIHRTKLEQADDLYQRQKGKDLKPCFNKDLSEEKIILKGKEKLDIVLPGLGWICLSGYFQQIKLHLPKGIEVYTRKAIL